MSPKLPQVSGREVVQFLEKLGYQVIRQKGSHIRLRKITSLGEHNITVPNHKIMAKGTLNDIFTRVSLWNNINKDELLRML
ncbi:MAG: type II toxin-antitoxin system HicA family toxin [Nitrospirae bacterium]|nr:type II toxin-antitoxin system HicA family toxin [Nitrospirota bacterium]